MDLHAHCEFPFLPRSLLRFLALFLVWPKRFSFLLELFAEGNAICGGRRLEITGWRGGKSGFRGWKGWPSQASNAKRADRTAANPWPKHREIGLGLECWTLEGREFAGEAVTWRSADHWSSRERHIPFKPHFQLSFLYLNNIIKFTRKIGYYYSYLLRLAELYWVQIRRIKAKIRGSIRALIYPGLRLTLTHE